VSTTSTKRRSSVATKPGHAKSVGSGFGLFFVDAMMTEYGGAVDVEDNDDDGATFVLRLPTAE